MKLKTNRVVKKYHSMVESTAHLVNRCFQEPPLRELPFDNAPLQSQHRHCRWAVWSWNHLLRRRRTVCGFWTPIIVAGERKCTIWVAGITGRTRRLLSYAQNLGQHISSSARDTALEVEKAEVLWTNNCWNCCLHPPHRSFQSSLFKNGDFRWMQFAERLSGSFSRAITRLHGKRRF